MGSLVLSDFELRGSTECLLFDCRFCAHLKVSENTHILAPFLPKIMDGLLTLATQSTDDVLALVLESLRIVMSVSVVLCLSRDERSGKRIVWVLFGVSSRRGSTPVSTVLRKSVRFFITSILN